MRGRAIKLILQISVVVLFLANALYAQNVGKISGMVTDLETGEPLIGSNLILKGTNLGAAVGIDGHYFILNVPPGVYDMEVSMMGYSKQILTGLIVNSGRTANADFALQSAAVEMDAVVVEAVRPDVEIEKTSTSIIIRAEDVQQVAGMRDVGDVMNLAADVIDGHFRGGRANEELYVLQGMGITNPLDNSRAITPIMSAVEEVEVITSGFGAQYGNAQSGVVNISMKEGKSDKWRSYAEVRTRLAQRKHFGPSVYDLNSNRYLQTYSDIDEWRLYYNQVVQTELGQDSLLRIDIAKLGYDQARQGISQSYGDLMDYSAEISMGGPINDKMRMFVALSNNTSHSVLPIQHPNTTLQAMGNIVADVGESATLRLSGAYSHRKSYSADLDDHRELFWNLIGGVGNTARDNLQLGLRFTQAISPSTFYEIKLNMLSLNRKSGSGIYYPDSTLNTVIVDGGRWIGKINEQPDLFDEGPEGNGTPRLRNSRTYSLDASFTSQVTRSHMINAGIQANIYDLDVDEWDNRSITGSRKPTFVGYSNQPVEVSLYVQDKMEFEGMIANVGLRWDVWDANTTYHEDKFIDPQIEDGKVKTSVISRIQPRVGISFPVSVNTVFHLNYGSFMQRPSFQYLYQYEPNVGGTGGEFGNPTLEPQVTYMYDVGVTQGLGEGFTFDASGYYKNVKDQLEEALYYYNYTYSSDGTPIPGPTYQTYINRDYADIRGFRLQLAKRRGHLTGDINYHYSVATGKSSGVGNATPVIGIEGDDMSSSEYSVPKKDILLDFDKTHNMIINLAYRIDEKWGFKIGKGYPLENILISATSYIRSGRPYTYNKSGQNSGLYATMNQRMPMEYNTNIKITKRIQSFFGTKASIYCEVFNLFNQKRLNYSYITRLSSSLLTDYETKSIDDPSGIRYNDDSIGGNLQYGFDHSFILYSNTPRSFTVGMTVDF